ncbi:hypothetical protein EAG_11925 [Camponotus floridanus]|uniref:Uncharacterized protein n=1 Tax=Camponotus floridanus TaxID=104421 RepID=E2A8I7_CAMFO|nr:hypothetical protein EAG_11925 [Camponotus floridanus]
MVRRARIDIKFIESTDKRALEYWHLQRERLHCAQLSTRNSSIDVLSLSDNGIMSSRSNGRTRAYLSNGRRNSDESVMTDMRREVCAPFDAAPI